MRVLLDACVWGGAKEAFGQAGHDVAWAGDWETDPGDVEILNRAQSEGRVLVTLDKDFGELAIVRELPHCGIMRLVNFAAKQQGKACLAVLDRYGDLLLDGGIVTVEPGRLRLRAAGEKP